jgi:hypothetical protein
MTRERQDEAQTATSSAETTPWLPSDWWRRRCPEEVRDAEEAAAVWEAPLLTASLSSSSLCQAVRLSSEQGSGQEREAPQTTTGRREAPSEGVEAAGSGVCALAVVSLPRRGPPKHEPIAPPEVGKISRGTPATPP